MHCKFLSQKDIARLLNVSESTVTRDINGRGNLSKIKPFVVANSKRYSIYDVAAAVGMTVMQVEEALNS